MKIGVGVAVLSAVRHNPIFKNFYTGVVDASKPKKVAPPPLTILNALMRDKNPGGTPCPLDKATQPLATCGDPPRG